MSLTVKIFAALNELTLEQAAQVLDQRPHEAEVAETVSQKLAPLFLEAGEIGGICALRMLHDALPEVPEFLMQNSASAQVFQAGVDAVHEHLDSLLNMLIEGDDEDLELVNAVNRFEEEFATDNQQS